VLLGGAGSMELLSGLRDGTGQLLSAGLVSLVAVAAFVPFLVRLLRGQLRRRPA
jgi:hypothetical protein